MTDIELEHPPMPRRYVKRRAIATGLLVVLALTGAGAVAASFYYDSVPAPHLEDFPSGREQVAPGDLSAQVRAAFVASVDPEFYERRSALHASPITLGCVAALIQDDALDRDGSWRGRIMAAKLEDRYDLAQVLDCYLNSAEFAPGVVGLAAAAKAFAGHEAARLTTAEAVLLAGRLAPLGAAPRTEQEAAFRKPEILLKMWQHGWLSEAEVEQLGLLTATTTGRPG